MWSLHLLLYVWLSGSVRLPCMALVYWAGKKWKRLHFLTGSRKRWLLVWGCLGLIETLAIAGLLLAMYFPEFGFVPDFPGWAGRAASSTLNTFHLYNVLVDFMLGFLFGAIGEATIGVAFAALVWWIFNLYAQPAQMPLTIAPTQRYAISLVVSACALGITNRTYSLRPPTCFDCFAPHGVPFTYFHEGGFAGGEGFVWSGIVGDAFVVFALGAIIGWIWNRMSLSRSLEELSRRFKAARTRSKVILLVGWYKYRFRCVKLLSALIALALALAFVWHWSAVDARLSSLEKSIIPGMVIGIGAAITGIIAIAFSLSLFAIQQVADRGTPATVQEYARDRLLTLVYWVLAILASISFAAALLKADANYRTAAVTVGLASLLLSFILLYFHFRRVAKFSDPRYTVWRIYSRGEKQLKVLQKLRNSIVPKTSGTGT